MLRNPQVARTLVETIASAVARTHPDEPIGPEFTDAFFDNAMKNSFAEGQAAGWARALLLVLSTRGFTAAEEIRRQIESCTDIEQFKRWIDRSVNTESLVTIFGA